MAEDKFDRLLNALPTIAESVNKFESATVQERAFEALVRALGVAEQPAVAPPSLGSAVQESGNGQVITEAGEVDETETTTTTTRRKRRRPSTVAASADRDVDFMPQGKKSLQDFAAEKNPNSNAERNIVAVYYLEQVLDLSPISHGRILAAYKECHWPEPNDIDASLRSTASRKHWLDTSDRSSIRTTAPGRNQVEHKMPAKKAEKK